LNYSGASGVNNYFVNLSWSTSQSIINFTTVLASSDYEAGTNSLAVPDLTGMSGFPLPASSGTLVNWDAEVTGGTYGTSAQPKGTGSTWIAGNAGSYIEP
jgi:hypothetical protein